ncbi:MAG: type 1 glutamine amidotransferase [Bacillota bacterium]
MRFLVVQNVTIEGPGMIGRAISQAGWSMDIRIMDAGHRLPESLEGYQALIILGGPMNVYEEKDYPYLITVDALIKQALHAGLPVLGICLGAQLIAKALGARVYPNGVKEIGWDTVRLTRNGVLSPFFTGFPREFSVFQWHGDTFDIPPYAQLLGSSRRCLNQAFSFGKNVLALQFHLEVTGDMVREWVAAYAEELLEEGGPKLARKILQETKRKEEKYSLLGQRFCRNWLKECFGLEVKGAPQ